MNSVQQTVLGLVLVGAAFVLGTHFSSQNQNQDTQASQMENLVWQGANNESKLNAQQVQNSSQTSNAFKTPTLSLDGLEEANLIAENKEADSSSSELKNPDFGQFSIDNQESEVAEAEPAKEIAMPDFSSHFPEQVASKSEFVDPPTPKVDSLTQAEPQLKLRPSFDQPTEEAEPRATFSLGELRPNKPVTSNPQTVTQNKGELKTQTSVISVVSRDRSPIMVNTEKFDNYQTVAGDTLQKLAKRYYGDANYYLDIYAANQDRLNNPGEIPAGVQLRIPIYE